MVDERNGHGGNLQEMPNGWIWTTLGEIQRDESHSVEPSKTPDQMFELYSVTHFSEGKPEIVSGKEIGSNKQSVAEGTVLLCGINPRINRVWVVRSHSPYTKIASTEWRPFFKQEGIQPEYLRYFLQNNQFRDFLAANASGVGGSLMRVQSRAFTSYPFPLAPLPEQHRIVAKIEELFSDLDAGVAALRKVKAQLKRYRQAVLKAAVEGKLTAEWRAVNAGKIEPASALLERIRAERAKNANGKTKPLSPTGMAGLGELPEGWCWTTFAEIISEFRSGSTVVPQNEATEFPILRSSSIRSQKIDYADTRYLQEEGSRNPANFLKVGNLLFVRLSGSVEYVGDCALVRKAEASKIQYPDRIFCATLVDHRLGSYLEMWFASPSARKQTMALIKSTAGHKRISMDAIEQRNIPIPSVAELEVIVAEVERRLSVTDEIEKTVDQSLKQAERLQQSILKRAFAGKLVPQDPSDEPAEKLLERIRVAREIGHAQGVPQRGAPQRKHARKM